MPTDSLLHDLQALKGAFGVGRRVAFKLSTYRRRIADVRQMPPRVNFVGVVQSRELLARTQVYPFHRYARQIRERFGAEYAEIDVEDFARTADGQRFPQVKWVAFQSWFDLDDAEIVARAQKLRDVFPEARLTYLDFFAPLDLRYAQALAPHVRTYLKKQTFRDLARYADSTLGDTNLTDYYGRRFDIDMPERRFGLPEGFADKLVIGPNFCVSPDLVDAFAGEAPTGERPIDVHARIAVQGTDWYTRMRQEARAAALALDGVRTVMDGRVSRREFLSELRQSKVCFSPFGYGEVCWRDYEAIACGALLLKPRMDHVRTTPEIYVAGETYVPLEWDCSDYSDTVRRYLDRPDERRRIAGNAFAVVRDYLRSDRPVEELQPLFA